MRELRQISGGRFMACGNKGFDAIVEPVGRQVLFVRDAVGQFTNGLRWLEKRVHILRRQPGGEGEHHDRAAEQTNFACDALLSQFIRQRLQTAKDGFA